jgi:hypothetical protein
MPRNLLQVQVMNDGSITGEERTVTVQRDSNDEWFSAEPGLFSPDGTALDGSVVSTREVKVEMESHESLE